MDKPEQKTLEQIQAEAHLNELIPDEQTDAGEAQGQAGGVIVDAVQSLGGLLGMIGFAFTVSGFNNLGAVWSDEQKNAGVAKAFVPVLRKYAFGQKILNFLEGETPIEEMALLMALSPMVVGSVNAYKIDVQIKQEAAKSLANKTEGQAA